MAKNVLCFDALGFFFRMGINIVWIAKPCERAAASWGKFLPTGCIVRGPSGAVAHMYTINMQ